MSLAPPPEIFDRRRVQRARARAAARFHESDFLHRRAMADIVDRLETVTRDFPKALFYGAGDLVEMLTPACGVGLILHSDLAAERLSGEPPRLVFDEENPPFAPGSLDLIVSLLTLHDVNDPLAALGRAREALKPDGLFIAALFGEETLRELRTAFYEAESELTGGVSPRLPPFAGLKDLGALLQRAGFALPVADLDTVSVRYGEPLRLLRDLQQMGETNTLKARPKPLSREVAAAALHRFAEKGGAARFDIVYLTGWAPHPGQQKAMKPGSAQASMADAVRAAGGAKS